MEISGIPSGANAFLVNTSPILAPHALPEKVPPKVEEKSSEALKEESANNLTASQTSTKPTLTKTTQSFSSLLKEIGLPDTKENNQLANVLANYGQPVNKQTMTQISRQLAPLMQKGVPSIEAGVILLMNNIKVNPKNAEAVKQLLTGGGMSQNLLVLNKDLKKMLDKLNDSDFTTELSKKVSLKQTMSSENKTEKIEEKKPNEENDVNKLQKTKNQEEPVQEVRKIIKGEKDEKDNQTSDNNHQQQPKIEQQKIETKALNLIRTEDLPPKMVVENLTNNVQKLSNVVNNLLTIDVLKNPALFPQQISMLKKLFSDFEFGIEDLKELIETNFPELKNNYDEEETSFIDLLQNLFQNNEKSDKITKNSQKQINSDLTQELMNELNETTESTTNELVARQILTKSEECMCIPIPINVNGILYNTEIMVRREDNSNKKSEVGEVPLKITLAIDTKNLGMVGVDISNLKKDLQILLSVNNQNSKSKIDKKLRVLESNLKKLPFDLKPLSCALNTNQIQKNSILLPNKYKVMSLNRIEGVF